MTVGQECQAIYGNILPNQCKCVSVKRFIHWLWINGDQWPIYAESLNGNRTALQSLPLAYHFSHLTNWYTATRLPHISRIFHCAASPLEKCSQAKRKSLNSSRYVNTARPTNCRCSPRVQIVHMVLSPIPLLLYRTLVPFAVPSLPITPSFSLQTPFLLPLTFLPLTIGETMNALVNPKQISIPEFIWR